MRISDWSSDVCSSDLYLLSMLMTLVLAGLDTTKSQLGYNFWHLATHPEDRGLLAENPDLFPAAIEELLRYYAFVRSEERSVGKGCVRPCRSRWSPYH